MSAFHYQAVIVQGVAVPLREHAQIIKAGREQFTEGEVVDVTEEKHVRRRSLKQNARFWALMGSMEDLGWERDEVKEYCCEKFLPPIVKELPDGTREERPGKTKNLNVKEMTEFMDRIERWLVIDQGVQIRASGVK